MLFNIVFWNIKMIPQIFCLLLRRQAKPSKNQVGDRVDLKHFWPGKRKISSVQTIYWTHYLFFSNLVETLLISLLWFSIVAEDLLNQIMQVLIFFLQWTSELAFHSITCLLILSGHNCWKVSPGGNYICQGRKYVRKGRL